MNVSDEFRDHVIGVCVSVAKWASDRSDCMAIDLRGDGIHVFVLEHATGYPEDDLDTDVHFVVPYAYLSMTDVEIVAALMRGRGDHWRRVIESDIPCANCADLRRLLAQARRHREIPCRENS